MAEDVLVTYKVGESIYQIPASNQEKLLEKYPDAERMSTFNYGGEDYYIPNQNAEKFISKYPDAEPMDNDANIFMQSYRGKQNRGIPTITVTEGEENGLTSTLAESEDVSQKPKASNGDIATPQPVNDTFFKEDAATQQQNIAKDKKDRAIAEQIYNTFESKPELFKTVEAREKFYDLLASKGYANAFSIGESMVSGDSRFDQRDEKESYIPNAGIDYVIGRRRHDDIVNTPVMRDPAVQLKLHTTFTNAGEGLQQTINTLNAGGDNEQQRSMAKDFSLLQTRLSSIQKAEKEGRINTQGAKDAIKNLSDAAANIRKKYKNYIDGVTEEGEQKKTFEEKITGESIEGKKDFAGISLDTKPTQQKVKGLSKDAREKVLSTLDDIESLYKKFSSVSAQSNAAYVNRPENQYQLATALSEMGKFKESNKILGELLNKNAASYQIYQAAAYNYYQLGDNAAARSMQIAAQQRQPISDIPSNEGGDTTGLDMGLGNPANPQYGNQGSPTPASEEMGLIVESLRHYAPLYSNAANISEGWMHALEKLKKGGIDYSKLQQAKNFGDVVKLGVSEGARIALNTIAGFAEGLFVYSMNTTPVGMAFVEATQGLTSEGVKATIGKVGAEAFNYFRGLKGSDKVTPDEVVAAIMMPVTTVLQGKEMRGAEIPEWAKDVGLIADVIAMHLFMGAVSKLKGTEEAKTAQDILDGKEVTVEHTNNLFYSIVKSVNEEGGVIYKIQHEYAEKLKELEKAVADFPETREVLQPEIEATKKKLEDIQGTLLHHDILTESARVEIEGKETALSALKDAIEKQKEGSAVKPILEEKARQLQEEIDRLEAERLQKVKDAVDTHMKESAAKAEGDVLDIKFGDYVDYGGVKGRVERRPDGVVVVTPDGKEVLVEGGFSGKRLKDLGLKKIEEPKGGEPKGGEPKTEPQPETEVEQGVAEVKAPDVKFNFEENTVTVDGKKYTYDGVGVDKDGNTTSIRVIDENGNVRHLRNEEVVFEIELQKETAELGMIEKSEVEAAAKELNIKEQKNEKETRGTPEKQQGVVEKLQPAEQAKAVEENKGEQKQEQLKTQDDAVQEQKTKGVDVRQQAADGEAVGERNAKGQEITDKGEAEKIKKQIAEENAKSEWQKEQEAIDNDSSLSEEEKEKKKIESTAKALDDKYFEDKRVGKQKQLELIDLIPKEQVDNPSTNGFYRVSKMDENLVSKQSKEAQENIKKLNDIFKEKNREDVISEAYHADRAAGKETELTKAVEELLGKPTEKPKTETTPTVSSEVVSGSALKDVESTAKALEGVDKIEINKKQAILNAEKIDKGSGSHVKKMSLGELNELARDMISNEKYYQDKLQDAQGVYNLAVERIQELSESYHKAKSDGSNPELVEAVEDLLGKAPTQYTEAATPAKKESGGVSGSALKDVESRKKEMKSENDKLIKRKRELANDRDDVVTGEGKYKNFSKKERDARLEEIRNEVNDIDAKQVSLQKELKVIEAKETGSVELFDHYSTGHGSTNTIIYDIKNDKLVERENVVRGKTKDISIEDAAKQKFAKSLRGRNQREINEAYTEKEKAKYEGEIKDEIDKYKQAPTQYTEAATPKPTGAEDSALKDVDLVKDNGKKIISKALGENGNDASDFKNTKVVDDNGKPKQVFHGTWADAPFEDFKEGDTYFTDNYDTAKMFGSNREGGVDTENMDMQGKPFVMEVTDTKGKKHKMVIANTDMASIFSDLQYDVSPVGEWGKEDLNAFDASSIEHHFGIPENKIKSFKIEERQVGKNVDDFGVSRHYINLENPLIIDAKGDIWNGSKGGDIQGKINEARESGKHDGVIVKNIVEGGLGNPDTKPTTTYVVFNKNPKAPTQYTEAATPAKKQSEGVSGSALKDVVRQESDAEKLNKEAGVDIYVARQDIDTNGGKYTLSQIKENGNTNTFLIEDAKGNEVGKAQLSANGNYLENIRIDEKHRRKGLASKVYDFIELRKGIELEPSPNKQSKEAKALWDKRNLQKSVSNKANGGLLAKALGESMSKTFADFRNKQQVLLELENKYFEQKGLSKEEFNKLSENEKSEIIKDAIKWKNDNPELVKAVEDLIAPKVAPTTNTEGETQTTEAQLQEFGVPEQDVKPVTNVLTAMVDGLRKAGLTAAKTVGEWLQIGKGEEKPYTLKINGEEKTVKPVNAEVVNGFYSPLEKIITESKFDKLPAKQWAEKYANSEEAKWTGLKDWLAQQDGSVSKADIQKYLKDNRIQVVEVVKGEVSNFTKEDIADVKINQHGAGNWVVKTKEDGTVEFPLDKADDKAEAIEYALEQLNYDNKSKRESKPKFQQYQLEGEKENYREVLVTMPNDTKGYYALRKEFSDYSANKVPRKSGEDIVAYQDRYKKELENDKDYQALRQRMIDADKKQKEDFKSSHFDEPNILVHLRMNTRVDSDGKRVLFLEEVQSDFAQAGRKQGFKLTEQEAGKAWEEADKEYAKFMKRMESKYGSEWESEMEKAEVEEETKLLDARENTKGGTIPQAPFVTDTNSWTKLGLKVALKEAVKQGADKIAWSTGTQQFDRWGSEKISWKKEVSEKYPDRVRWKIDLKEQESGNAFDGINIDEKALSESNVSVSTKEQLREVLNRNLKRERNDAEIDKLTGRIWDRMQKEDSGTSLPRKEGMESFYGKPDEGKLGIVGNVAKSLFKQEPSLIKIVDKDTPSIFNRYNEKKNELSEKESRVDELYNEINNSDIELPKQAREYNLLVDEVQDLRKEIKDIERTSPNALKQATSTSTQHSIDITPEMKKQVETEGQPLFKDAEAQYRIESGKNIVEALKDFDGSPKAVTAIVHEFMHPTVVEIFNGAKEGNETGARHANTIVEEYNKANPDKKITLEQMIEGNDAFINGRTTPEYRAVQEFIAEAWEKYHHEGAKGFSKAFQEVLDAITEVFRQVYKSLTGVTLTPELRKMFDELLGMEEVKQEQKQEKPAIEKTLVEEHGVAKEDAAIVTSVLDKLNKGLQSMGVSFDITKGLQLGKGKEGSEASAHAQFRIDKGKRIVEILKSDLPAKEKATAVLHEVGHLSLHELLQQHIDGSTPEIKKALDTMIKAFNESGRSGEAKKRLGGDVTIEKLIEEHNAFKEQGEKINAASTEALSDNIPNFRDFHEFITDSLNKYLKDGTAGFGKEFDAVLQKIKELLVHVYDTVRGGTLEGLTVSPELKQVFDRMLGKDVDLFKEPEKPQAKPLGEVKVDMPTTDEQGRVMSLSEALRMAKEQGQIKGKETGGLKHSEGMSEADFVAMYQKQQQDNLRAELLGAEDVDVAHTAGEERISQRQRKWKAVTVKEAKKIIEGLDPKYESTNAESVNSLVDRIFAPFQDYIKAGVDVFDVASEYAKSIYPKDRTEPYAAQKAAVATVLMTKAANELRMGFRFADSAAAGSERGVFKRGTLEYDIAAESLKKFEDYLSGDKRVDATALAFANSHINPNEVYALLDAIDNSRKKVMGEKAKSGRTKEEVAKEMRTLKPTAEEVDTAAEKATAKTTKVKPKRSLFSGSTTKKTRSTISVERKKSAKDKLKSGLSKIQAAIPSAKPTPKKGGLTEEPPLPKGVVEGVKDIAEAAISEGHYTQEAIKDYVAEKTKGILDRATSDGIIDKAWDGEIKQKSGAARADEVSYAIVKALKTGKGDAITKQLGEALLMQDAEYDPSSKTKRQQATARLAEILKDPAAAEARLNAAINMVVNQSIVNPKMLDYLGLDPVDFLASKENPHGMTMEQFEAFSRDMLKKKLYDMAQDFMGHGVHEQRVLPLPKKRIKPSASEVKKFIKDFYDNPEMTDSMLETALTDHFDITPEQATAIASKVRGELADIVASRSQKKIDALAEEISDGDRTKKKRVTDMVVKALTTNGAFGDIPFSEKMAAALSNRSVAPADINKILAYGRMANATDSSLLKAFYMRKAATILSKYDMSAASFLFQGLYEQGVVNILGNPRTSILTASLSMLKTMPFDVVRMFVTRPSTFVRAVRFSKLIGSKGIGSVTGEGFRAILNGVETVRNRAEIETKPQIRRESANKQARLTSWRYLRKASLSGNDPKRAQLFILKALQSLTLSAGSLRQNIGGKTYEFSPTHWLVNLISGLDVVVKAGLMNLHNYYNAERFIRESGIKFGTSEFTKKMSEMLTTDPLIFDAIDKQVNMEVADAMKNGIPLPKDYVHERKTQLYQEYVDKDVVSQSLFEINKSALIGIPRTWLGAHTYNFIRSNTEIKDNEKTVNAAVKYIFGSALYFSRVGINVIERRGRGIPFYNMFLAAAPYEFTIDASGKVVRRTTESGKVIRRVENKRDFAFGILQATTTTALAVMLINNIFQQEDLKDEKGNPVIDPATGEPVKHWVLNPSSPIRFHGRKKALTITEKNAVPAMCIELTNVEDPDKRFWKFEWFPESWYPMLFMLGEESDDIRYKEEKLQVGGTEKDNSMLRSVQEEPTSMFRIVTTAGIGAFNASFTTPAQTADEASRLISQDKKRDAAATIAYRLTGQPFITTVNPRLAGQIADAYDYFKEREKTYVKLSIENTNIRSAVSNMAQYSMNQVWAGRYLVNNEDNKYTIYDAHGQPMEREPGDLLFLPAMFSEDMYYGWAEHIYKSPLYKIYMDDNGNFDESVIAIPNRIGWNDKVSVSDMVKQQVRQKTREYYGQLVTKFYGKLLSTPYEERGEFIKELWKAAVNEAKTEYGAKEKTVEGAVGVMQRKNMTDGNAKEE